MSDPYAEAGEFHDLFMPEPWERLVPALKSAFGDLGPEATLLDIGAGSGVGTVRLARSTRARIVAVEPSLTMRTALLARIVDDEDLSTRVSVLAGSVPAILAEIDGPIGGFVCAHMLGHLSMDDRRATFASLAAMLTPGGRGLITLPRDTGPVAPVEAQNPAPLVEEQWIGRHRYTATHLLPAAHTAPATTIYRVSDGDRTLRSLTSRSSWSMPPLPQLEEELHEAGLKLTLPEDSDDTTSVGIIRPAAADGRIDP